MALWFKRWSNFDSARSLGEWVWWGICHAFNLTGAGVIAWLFTYWDAYWQYFNLAGYAIAFLISIIILPLAAILVAEAKARLGIGLSVRSSTPEKLSGGTDFGPAATLESVLIVGGHPGRPPEYRARFRTSGRDGAIYLEHESFSGEYGGGWTVRQVILLQRIERYIDGEQVILPLCGVMETKEGPRWHWQPAERNETGYPQNMIGINWTYRGRVRFVSSGDKSESCYFIATTRDHSEMPHVTGEHMFAHIQEWEGRMSRNGNPRTLFKHA